MSAQKRDAPELQQTLLAFSIPKRARSNINERELVIEIQPTSNSQPPEAGTTSSVHSQDIQISNSPNVIDVSITSSGVNIFTEPYVPDVTNSSPQDSDFIVNESAFKISFYDVGKLSVTPLYSQEIFPVVYQTDDCSWKTKQKFSSSSTLGWNDMGGKCTVLLVVEDFANIV
ncbi:hypothetical protein LOD99_8614 [Oopsacas minuta]|uniref:Uncharacterized protein n=1 Tax=Oopsacas minuta TaxID=111878 RepID=A0AAV7JGQ1_9METZ|nr:hypothetical protein LOD99_8614 [Oopsacas minuta]